MKRLQRPICRNCHFEAKSVMQAFCFIGGCFHALFYVCIKLSFILKMY